MRWLPVLGVLCAAGCGDGGWPDGTYLLVDGQQAQIEFDEVEVLFAKHHSSGLPSYTPSGYQPHTDDVQLLLKRVATAESGVQSVPTGQRIDLYIPPDVNELHGVGTYAVVIASRDGVPVGIGEVLNFDEQPADITRYQIALRAYPEGEIERWGRAADGPAPNDCLRWTRNVGDVPRSIAIVREHDNDCDAYPDARVDCDARAYCDGEGGRGCEGTNTPCADSTTCALGRCVNGSGTEDVERTCEPTTCLMDAACEKCDENASTEDYLRCAAQLDTQLDVEIAVKPDDFLCQQRIEFPVPVSNSPCVNPVVEWWRADDAQQSPFRFMVSAEEGTGACLLALEGPLDERFEPHHVLVSIDVVNLPNPGTLTRTMFTLGVRPGEVTNTCAPPLYRLTTQPKAIAGSCLQRL